MINLNPEQLRGDFPIFRQNPDLAYLDSAATTQKPEAVIERIEKFYRSENSNVGRGLYDLASEATQEYESVRSTVADFIGAKRSSEIVFVRNTTEAINLLAETLELEGNIVLPEMEHHSSQLPWRKKAENSDLEIRWIPTRGGKIDLEEAGELIDGDTALVAISHISNVFGTVNPVEKVSGMAEENSAYFMLDGAQSVPRKPVDIDELGVDFLTFSGHKMLGPTGTGVLYGRKEILEDMEPYQVGGGMIRSVSRDRLKWEDVPQKFEAGTPNVAGVIGLGEAIRYLENIGMEDIWNHDVKLSGKLKEGLLQIEGVEIVGEPSQESCLVSFTMDGIHPHDIAEILNQEGVAVRAGHHCAQPLMEQLELNAAVRVSPYLYNTEEDIEKLLEGLRKVKEVFE